jgi:hypothetical protein
MDKKVIIIIILNILSLINVFWATNMQTTCDISNYDWPTKYFMHSLKPGSVCEFGIQSGKLICIWLLINLILTVMYNVSNIKNKKQQLTILMYVNITILSIVFICSLLMNSGLNYHANYNFYQRGLWENLSGYWIFGIINIILLNKIIKEL